MKLAFFQPTLEIMFFDFHGMQLILDLPVRIGLSFLLINQIVAITLIFPSFVDV